MDYVGILRRAASITWRNKALWLFGFLVALFEGGSHGSNGGGASGFRWPGEGAAGRMPTKMPDFSWVQSGSLPTVVLVVIAAALLLVAVAIVLNMVGNAALMGLVRDVEGGRRAGVRRGFGIGFGRFWPYFGVNFVVSVPAGLLTAGLILLGCSPLLLLLVRRAPATAVAVALTAILMVPIGLFLVVLWSALSILLEFFLRACVVERKGVTGALSRGWDVFAANVGRSLLMALLLFGCGFLFGLLMIPLAIGLVGGAVMSAVLAWVFTRSIGWAVGIGLALGVPAILILVFASGVYKSFTSGAWTLAYLRMAGLEQAASVAVAGPAEPPAPEPVPAESPAVATASDVVVDGARE